MWTEYEVVLVSVEDVVDQHAATRPGLIGKCKECHWRSHCRREIVAANDLTLIFDLGLGKREKFPPGIATVADLADADLSDLIDGGKSAIPGIGAKMLQTYHARAVVQKKEKPEPYFTEDVRLPASELELFFDVETDPFRGLCYMHGFVERAGRDSGTERYEAFFADEAVEEAERDAFARAWAYVQEHHDAAVYYFGHHERTTWRQLARRYPEVATEEDVMALFEDDRFVNLYDDVVRSRMIWPTYSLSLKTLASFLGFSWRDTDPSGAGSIQWFHQWVETGGDAIRRRILEYNEDDCRATRVLVDALRGLASSR